MRPAADAHAPQQAPRVRVLRGMARASSLAELDSRVESRQRTFRRNRKLAARVGPVGLVILFLICLVTTKGQIFHPAADHSNTQARFGLGGRPRWREGPRQRRGLRVGM